MGRCTDARARFEPVPGLSLGTAPDSLFHPGGTAIVIHASPDDNKTDPAGNAGARIACGVVEKP
jgi:Cu-Zn family superoxide dismutase